MGGCFSRLLNILTTSAQGPLATVDITCACFESTVNAETEEENDEPLDSKNT